MSDQLGYSLYRSTASRALHASELDDILTGSRVRNAARNLTGCLHYEGGLFFQWLEGPQAVLDQVVAAIGRDDRHRDLVVLVEGPLQQRQFRDWQMRFSDSGNASLLDWLGSAQVSTLDRRDYAQAVMTFLRSVTP